MSKKITALIPGAALALGIACIAKWLETLESSAGLHLIGASVIALFIGMAINAFFQPNKTTAPGIKFTSKKVLKFAIVLLGASLNIRTVLTVGRFSLTVMLFTLATCFGLGAQRHRLGRDLARLRCKVRGIILAHGQFLRVPPETPSVRSIRTTSPLSPPRRSSAAPNKRSTM